MSHLHQKYILKNNEENDKANSESDSIYRDNNNDNNHIKDKDKIIFHNKTAQAEDDKNQQSKNNMSGKLSN